MVDDQELVVSGVHVTQQYGEGEGVTTADSRFELKLAVPGMPGLGCEPSIRVGHPKRLLLRQPRQLYDHSGEEMKKQQAATRFRSSETMSKVSVKGVLLGGITDSVASAVLGIPFAIYAVIVLDFTHIPKSQPHISLAAAIHANTLLYSIQILIGLGGSALGGYVAAWLAKHDELLNGTLSSFLCILIGVYSIASGKSRIPRWRVCSSSWPLQCAPGSAAI